MNRDLDRSLVVPTVEDEDAAFLGEWLREAFAATPLPSDRR